MKIPKRIASAIINSLKGGVVPRIGLPYITVGREQEINALLHDVDIIADGGASFRFIVGKYGSGKSFLLQTIRSYVMDRNFVVVDADLSPERRLQGTKGQGLATYKELIRNMSTKTRPDGGALTLILDRWISNVQSETAAESGLDTNDPQFRKAVERKIYEVIGALHGNGARVRLCQTADAVLQRLPRGRRRMQGKRWSSGSAGNTIPRPKPGRNWA